MSNPWPERQTWTLKSYGQLDETIEENKHDYLIRMVQQLFVELAELRTLVAQKMTPIYQMDFPENPYQISPDLLSNHGEKP